MHFHRGHKRIGDHDGNLPGMILQNLNVFFGGLFHFTGVTNAERQIQGALSGAWWHLRSLIAVFDFVYAIQNIYQNHIGCNVKGIKNAVVTTKRISWRCFIGQDRWMMDGQVAGWTGQIDRQIARQLDSQIDRQIEREIEREIDRQIDRQIDRYIDRQIDRQIRELLVCPRGVLRSQRRFVMGPGEPPGAQKSWDPRMTQRLTYQRLTHGDWGYYYIYIHIIVYIYIYYYQYYYYYPFFYAITIIDYLFIYYHFYYVTIIIILNNIVIIVNFHMYVYI